MLSLLLSLLPRRALQAALFEQWTRTLSPADRRRVQYWGATGNPAHHEYAWAAVLPSKTRPPEDVDLTPAQNAELARRVATFEVDSKTARSWNEIKAELEMRS